MQSVGRNVWMYAAPAGQNNRNLLRCVSLCVCVCLCACACTCHWLDRNHWFNRSLLGLFIFSTKEISSSNDFIIKPWCRSAHWLIDWCKFNQTLYLALCCHLVAEKGGVGGGDMTRRVLMLNLNLDHKCSSLLSLDFERTPNHLKS